MGMSNEARAAFDALATERPISVAELLPAQARGGALPDDTEVAEAIAAVLCCWLAEDRT